ncbi:MAG TPA: ABC transporter permease [Candidatus Limnocylindrales bacterium]|nr:ABC transporter permease [Candidatus Limnocylindrales bacterium]
MPPGRFVGLVWQVARREYLRTVRRVGYLFATLLLPGSAVIFLAVSAVAAGGARPIEPSPAELTIHLVNESGVSLGDTFRPGLLRLVERGEGMALLQRGEIGELYILPAGYPGSDRVERLILPTRGVDVVELERRQRQAGLLEDLLRRALASASDLPGQTVERLVEPMRLAEATTTGATGRAPLSVAMFVLPYAFSTLFVISIFVTSGYLLQSVTEEKESRVIEIVLSSVPALPLMAGKIVGLGGAGLTQVAIWVVTALVGLPLAGERIPGLDQVRLAPEMAVLAVVYFLLGYLVYGALFSAVGALAPGTREAQQYAGFFGMFAVVPLLFTGAFLADIESPIVTALSLFPLTAPAAVLQVLILTPEPPWLLVAASLALLIGFAALATAASARVFRATILLYGTRPSLRRIADAIARG